MTWIFAAVALATAGLVVLGVLTVRVFMAARVLGREIGRTSQKIGSARDELGVELSAIRPPQG